MKTKSLIIVILCFGLLSCTYFKKSHNQTEGKISQLQEEQLQSVVFWNWLSAHALQLNTNKNQFTDLSERSTANITDLIGIPAKEDQIEIKQLLPTDTKLSVRQSIEKQLAGKQLSDRERADSKSQQDLIVLQDENKILTDKLTAYGAKFEAERNKTIWWHFWEWTTGTLVIAGLIALFVFCPAAIPVVLTILKWIFSKFVGLIQYVVPAMVNTVKGIANTKAVLTQESEINKALPPDKQITYKPEEIVDLLRDELSKAQDTNDKAVISKVKTRFNI